MNSTFFARKVKKKIFLYEYLLSHPCVDCGENDPIVLEFDHVSPRESRASFASMSLPKLRTEIVKCQVRCANCHKRRHRSRTTDIEALLRGENMSLYQLMRDEIFAKQQRRQEKARKAVNARWTKHRLATAAQKQPWDA